MWTKLPDDVKIAANTIAEHLDMDVDFCLQIISAAAECARYTGRPDWVSMVIADEATLANIDPRQLLGGVRCHSLARRARSIAIYRCKIHGSRPTTDDLSKWFKLSGKTIVEAVRQGAREVAYRYRAKAD